MSPFLKAPARIIAASLVVLGSTVFASAEPFRLVVTDLEAPLVPNSVMDLAVNLGYFEREGVDVELVRVQQTPSAIAAIQAGEGDMANIGVDALIQLVARGTTGLKAVVSPNKSLPFLIAAKSEIATPADLAGRSFGVGRVGSLDHSLSTKVLESQGVDPEALEIVTLGQPAVRAQALAAQQIDATTISIGVWLSLPEKEGLHVLIDQDAYYEAAPVVSKVNVVTQDALDTRRDDVEAVVRALVKISRDFAANPQSWVEAMTAARPDVAPADLEQLAQSFAQSWSVNGGISREELAYTSEWLYQGEDFTGLPAVTLDQWVDFSIADAVLAELGTEPDMDQPTR